MKLWLLNIKNNISKLFKSCFRFDNSNKSTNVWNSIFFISLSVTVALTLLFQSPIFADNSINAISIVLWMLLVIVAFITNYKKSLIYLFFTSLGLVPFLLTCIISLFIGNNFFSAEIFRLILLSLLMFYVGAVAKSILKKEHLIFIGSIFVVFSFIMTLIITFDVLLPSFVSGKNSFYAYPTKNSSSPILAASTIIPFLLLKGKLGKTFSWVYFFYISFFILIIKCRAVVVVLPILGFYLAFKTSKSINIPLSILLVVIVAFILIIAIPPLNKLIIQDMLFNNKTNLDDIFSGRISLVIIAIQKLDIFKGNASYYVDCMPVMLLCNFGIFGLLSLLPLLIFPALIGYQYPNGKIKLMLVALSIIYYSNSIFEGYGMFGTGAKVFIFWLFAGYCFPYVLENKLKISYLVNKVYDVSDSISPRLVLNSISVLIIGVASLFVTSSNICNTVLSDFYNKIENATSTSNEYVYAEKLEFNKNNKTEFCVGQSYTFEYDFYPLNTTDKSLRPSGWGVDSSYVTFDKGENVKAHFHREGGYILSVFSEKVRTLSANQLIKVVSPLEYRFDDINIWFETNKKIDEITVKLGQSFNVCYDATYVPSINYLSFETDTSLLSWNENVFTAINPGVAYIHAYGSNNRSSNISNKLKVNIIDEKFAVPDSIFASLDGDQYFTNTAYDLNVNFGNSVFDNYIVKLNNNIVGYNVSQIIFDSEGINIIEIQSLSNPSLSKVLTVEDVKLLKPIEFIEGDNHFVISEGAKNISLFLRYNDNSIRPVTPLDIYYDYANENNRATSLRSGIISNNGLLYYPLITGVRYLDFVAIDDATIKITLKVQASSISPQDRQLNILNLGLILASFLFAISNLLFLNNKNNKILILSFLLLTILLPWLRLLICNFNLLSVLINIICNILSVSLFIICNKVLKSRDLVLPNSTINRPVNINYMEIKI